jgi:CRP-like cAMP-binding protein
MHRLITLIDYLKKEEPGTERFYRVPYTRKELAEMTGLRVETVIRNIKALEKLGFLTIKNRKVYREIRGE